ncbi:MAG: hypothetical protein AAGJ34_06630 [Pseudomonadota bacterium]
MAHTLFMKYDLTDYTQRKGMSYIKEFRGIAPHRILDAFPSAPEKRRL